MENNTETIIVVGGGAGGLEVLVRLARRFKRDKKVDVVLVDHEPAHIWKPLLHEVATGSLDSNHDEISYLGLARRYKFRFLLGSLQSINAQNSEITIVQTPYHKYSSGVGAEIPPVERTLAYTQLVLCVGSVCNDFNTPGVTEHAIYLDSREQAEQFHQRFINNLHYINNQRESETLDIVVVGGGATGVELSADLHGVSEQLGDYGFEGFDATQLSVTLLEAGPRLLAALPERISQSVAMELDNIGIQVKLDARVTEIAENRVLTDDGVSHNSHMTVWSAGIKAPSMLYESGLAVDRIGRVIVTPYLNLTEHPAVFALGDCCHCETENNGSVPPRAQSAHQMAATVYTNILRQRQQKQLKNFKYRDFGSLVSLGEYTTIGNLMGNLSRGTLFIEGWIARLMYRSLYRLHQKSIHGYVSVLLIMLGDRIHRVTRSQLKLH